jgi:FkbM family methyltransferase
MSKVIYDFGMNNGDDIEYYLKKGLKVVGVEANPALCRSVEERFADSILSGRLTILNVALSDRSTSESIRFYVNKRDHVLSQMASPSQEQMKDFEPIQVPQKRALEVVREHGTPYYIKIDIEGMDAVVLRDVLEGGILPEFLSAEIHTPYVFALLVTHGYDSFTLVDGATVHEVYKAATIVTPGGRGVHVFKRHSAGPFGEDITSPWWDSSSFVYVLAAQKMGWKDVHASRVIRPTPNARLVTRLTLREHLEDLFPSFIRSVRSRFRAPGREGRLSGARRPGTDV